MEAVEVGESLPNTASFFEFVGFPLKSFPQRGNYFFCIFFLRVSPRFRMISIHDIKDEKEKRQIETLRIFVSRDFWKNSRNSLTLTSSTWTFFGLMWSCTLNTSGMQILLGEKIKLFPSRKLLLTLA